eukprot:TRINITY_DN47562_c0_g1_i1.p1 TRINITY_DN47562_c0_g1~~TRINITY_DN47562_c0_g1_i1.p1  ORF type:complete len:127 (+),score=3.22 TRINITY_DN47562_c0_g1_i1:51-431(+)
MLEWPRSQVPKGCTTLSGCCAHWCKVGHQFAASSQQRGRRCTTGLKTWPQKVPNDFTSLSEVSAAWLAVGQPPYKWHGPLCITFGNSNMATVAKSEVTICYDAFRDGSRYRRDGSHSSRCSWEGNQ